MQGEVVAKNPATSEITVNHGDIPGFMAAMAMPYRVKDPAVVQELRAAATKSPRKWWLAKIRATTGWRTCASPTNLGAARSSRRLRRRRSCPENELPDVTLINQDGRKIRLSDFAGKALLVDLHLHALPHAEFLPPPEQPICENSQ